MICFTIPLNHVRGPVTLLNLLKVLANLRLEQLSHMCHVFLSSSRSRDSESYKEGFHSNGRVFFASYILFAYTQDGYKFLYVLKCSATL